METNGFESLLEPEDVLLYAADAARTRRAAPGSVGVTERWMLHLTSAVPFDEFREHVRLNLLHQQQVLDEGHMASSARAFGDHVRRRGHVKQMVKSVVKAQGEWVNNPTAPSPPVTTKTEAPQPFEQQKSDTPLAQTTARSAALTRSTRARKSLSTFGIGKGQPGDGSDPWLRELRGSFRLRNKGPPPKRCPPKPAPQHPNTTASTDGKLQTATQEQGVEDAQQGPSPEACPGEASTKNWVGLEPGLAARTSASGSAVAPFASFRSQISFKEPIKEDSDNSCDEASLLIASRPSTPTAGLFDWDLSPTSATTSPHSRALRRQGSSSSSRRSEHQLPLPESPTRSRRHSEAAVTPQGDDQQLVSVVDTPATSTASKAVTELDAIQTATAASVGMTVSSAAPAPSSGASAAAEQLETELGTPFRTPGKPPLPHTPVKAAPRTFTPETPTVHDLIDRVTVGSQVAIGRLPQPPQLLRSSSHTSAERYRTSDPADRRLLNRWALSEPLEGAADLAVSQLQLQAISLTTLEAEADDFMPEPVAVEAGSGDGVLVDEVPGIPGGDGSSLGHTEDADAMASGCPSPRRSSAGSAPDTEMGSGLPADVLASRMPAARTALVAPSQAAMGRSPVMPPVTNVNIPRVLMGSQVTSQPGQLQPSNSAVAVLAGGVPSSGFSPRNRRMLIPLHQRLAAGSAGRSPKRLLAHSMSGDVYPQAQRQAGAGMTDAASLLLQAQPLRHAASLPEPGKRAQLPSSNMPSLPSLSEAQPGWASPLPDLVAGTEAGKHGSTALRLAPLLVIRPAHVK